MSRRVFTVGGLQVAHAAAAVFTIIMVARLLPKEDYGRYVYYSTIAAIVPLVTGFGVEHVLLMKGSRSVSEVSVLFGNALIVRCVTVLAVALGGVLYWMQSVEPETLAAIFIFVGSAIAVFPNPLFLAVYRVHGVHVRPWLLGLVGPAGFVCYLMFLGLYFRHRVSLESVAVGFLGFQLLTAMVMYPDVRALGRPDIRFSRLSQDRKLGMTFASSQALDYATARMDVFALQYFLGPAALAIYAAAQRIIGALQIIPTSFHLTELPDFHRNAGDAAALTARFRSLRAVMMDASLLVAGWVAAFSPEIIGLAYGEKYAGAVQPLVFLIVGNILVFLNYPYYMLAEAINRIGARLIAKVVAATVTGLALGLLIPSFGVQGAACALIAGNAVFVIGLHLITREFAGGLWEFLVDARAISVAAVAYLAACLVMGTERTTASSVAACAVYMVLAGALGLVFRLTGVQLLVSALSPFWAAVRKRR